MFSFGNGIGQGRVWWPDSKLEIREHSGLGSACRLILALKTADVKTLVKFHCTLVIKDIFKMLIALTRRKDWEDRKKKSLSLGESNPGLPRLHSRDKRKSWPLDQGRLDSWKCPGFTINVFLRFKATHATQCYEFNWIPSAIEVPRYSKL